MTAAQSTPESANTASVPAIIGHQPVLDFLQQAWERERLAHAYLLAGPTGTGKLAIARWFAGQVLGNDNLATNPDYCQVERGHDPKTGKLRNSIAIDQVHHLRGQLALGAMGGGWKVAVLDGAEQLNDAAANALLKTLEEPQRRTIMILTATTPEAVMATIRSRCQVIRLNRVARAEIAAGLRERGLAADQADRLARLAGGRPGEALRLAGTPEALAERLAERDGLLTALEANLTERWRGLEDRLPAKVSFNEQRQAVELELGLIAELLRDAWWLEQGLADRVVHADLSERLTRWAKQVGPHRLQAALAVVDSSRRRLQRNLSPKTALALTATALETI
jgi:DNA polymerase-3 subunit delta'